MSFAASQDPIPFNGVVVPDDIGIGLFGSSVLKQSTREIILANSDGAEVVSTDGHAAQL